MDKKPYYISTAIAYTSAKPHIGNTYEIVLADAIARYKRMTGYDVYFQTGTDEHGQKIQEKAEAAGITPQQHVDKVAGEVKTIWDMMNTTYDKFIRTTDPMHEKKVQKIFKKLYDQGDIYKGAYKGKYCKPCESFWTESQLKDGCCPDCGRPCVDAEEEAYFFRMSKYADRLMKHGARRAAAEAGIRSSVAAGRRRQDVQVARQRYLRGRSGSPVWCGCRSLLRSARDAVRK